MYGQRGIDDSGGRDKHRPEWEESGNTIHLASHRDFVCNLG